MFCRAMQRVEPIEKARMYLWLGEESLLFKDMSVGRVLVYIQEASFRSPKHAHARTKRE